MKGSHQQNSDEEIVRDATSDEEVITEEAELGEAALKDTLRRMRAELSACKKECAENLAGWQRAKADLINYRRTVEEDRVRDAARAKGRIVESIIPVLDSFENAMMGEKWQAVEVSWREGVERIAGQLQKALLGEGLRSFAEAGEPFDPARHECMGVTSAEVEGEDHTIAQVLQRGYAVGEEVVRPAKVIVYQFPS